MSLTFRNTLGGALEPFEPLTERDYEALGTEADDLARFRNEARSFTDDEIAFRMVRDALISRLEMARDEQAEDGAALRARLESSRQGHPAPVLGFTGTYMDLMMMSFSALIIGVAVDDSIHFFVRGSKR